MLSLPNNCRAGKMSVFPSNWKTVKANVKLNWYISYRFYDDNLKQSKKIVIKGLNHLDSLAHKQEAIKVLMSDELDLITRQGYNRITKIYSVESDENVTGFTPFTEAIQYAFELIKAEKNTILDLKSCLKYFILAAKELRYDLMPLKDFKRKHARILLEKCGKIKNNWSANNYNHYRAHLSMLFKELLKIDAIETNWVRDISKQKTVKRIRETLTDAQRREVDKFILDLDYNFWRFLHIFFHSGSRTTEVLAIQGKDVDLPGQRFKVTVKKGNSHREEWRPIKDTILPLWERVVKRAGKTDYLFSVGLVPGEKMIRREQITRRWRRHVKGKLGITADFYSLKHSNLDDIAQIAGLQAAQAAAGHTSSNTTLIYTTGEVGRQNEAVKKISNRFAKDA